MNFKNELDRYRLAKPGDKSHLIALLQSFHNIPIEFVQIIEEQTFSVNFPKGYHISSPEKGNRFIFFIVKGTTHGYLWSKGKKITTSFTGEGEFSGEVKNLWTVDLSYEYLETIEAISAIAIPNGLFKNLFETFSQANYIVGKIAESYITKTVESGIIARLPTVKERYERFIVCYPNLLSRIPLKYIASFLGMRLETLCRIRSILLKKKSL